MAIDTGGEVTDAACEQVVVQVVAIGGNRLPDKDRHHGIGMCDGSCHPLIAEILVDDLCDQGNFVKARWRIGR